MKRFFYPASTAVLFSLLFWCLPPYYEGSDLLQKAALQTRDVLFKVRRASTDVPKEAQRILIVKVDEESSQALGLRWPWPRRLFGELISKLREAGSPVVGMNFSFTGLEEESDLSTQEMADEIRSHGAVILGATFDAASRLVRPSPPLEKAAAGYGYLEKIVDPDYRIRRSYLLRLYSGANVSAESPFLSSFPLEVFKGHSLLSGAAPPRFDPDLGLLTAGRPTVAVYLDPDGSYPINYLAGEEDLSAVSAWRLLKGERAALEKARGRIALVGVSSDIYGDRHPTPLGIVSGAVIHANELLSLLSGRVLRFVPEEITFLISWLVSLAVLAFFLFRRPWMGLLAAAGGCAALVFGAEAAFARDFILEPFILLVGPVSAALTGLFSNSLQLLMENQGLTKRVIHDKLTGLYKYEYLREYLDDEWRRCKRGLFPVAIVMTDLDRFKQINDTLGHETGNDMIRRAGAVIQESARRYDVVSRYGGDEFVVLLSRTNLQEARAYRERLRQMYHEMARKLDGPLLRESSISIGVAAFDPAVDAKFPPDPQRLIEEADKDLFHDKESRRRPGEPRR